MSAKNIYFCKYSSWYLFSEIFCFNIKKEKIHRIMASLSPFGSLQCNRCDQTVQVWLNFSTISCDMPLFFFPWMGWDQIRTSWLRDRGRFFKGVVGVRSFMRETIIDSRTCMAAKFSKYFEIRTPLYSANMPAWPELQRPLSWIFIFAEKGTAIRWHAMMMFVRTKDLSRTL